MRFPSLVLLLCFFVSSANAAPQWCGDTEITIDRYAEVSVPSLTNPTSSSSVVRPARSLEELLKAQHEADGAGLQQITISQHKNDDGFAGMMGRDTNAVEGSRHQGGGEDNEVVLMRTTKDRTGGVEDFHAAAIRTVAMPQATF